MAEQEVVWVKCQFSRGGFPTELIFHIKAPGGGDFVGTAPAGYCFETDRSLLMPKIPPGQRKAGILPGIALERKPGEPTRVLLPDNEIYDIGDDQFEPKENAARVPLQSGY